MPINSRKERIIPGKGLVIDLVETLQQQMREIHAKALNAQNSPPELVPRNDSADQALQTERRYIGIVQKQLSDERKETKRLNDPLDHQRRFQSSTGTPVSQPYNIPQTGLVEVAHKEIVDLKKALKEEKTRSQWFKDQFADQQMKYTEVDTRASSLNAVKDAAVEALEREKKKSKDLEKALEIEKRVPLARKVLAEQRQERKALAEVDEELLNGRTRSQSVAGVSSSSSAKKRRLDPTLEEGKNNTPASPSNARRSAW
ncbi:hypothetical protein BPOR_0872g00020 [Botrytis porri]|uniref:Uncharacterized protein n=1 Tax=Botrytis porri TaxID=87229 RepID=A0A4Z1K862_9HELO|nr:hypothetical protein BPOR_0872g00020 [Botrytis porri]